MKHLCHKLKKFADSENGAVTVDWVVLTAAVVGLAGTAALQTQNGVNTAASTISNAVATTTTGTGTP